MAVSLLLIFAAIWFVFLAPPKVVAMTFAMLFVVALTIRALTVRISGELVSYGAALRAVALSIFLFLLAGFLLGALFGKSSKGLSFMVVGSPVSWLAPVALLLAFILGFHLCLPTSFKGSAIVALASTAISVTIFFLLRSVF